MTGGTIFINDNVVEVTNINGASMAPTLSPTYKETGRRDFVLFDKRFSASSLRRGDVVHFMAPHKPEGLAVKRVVGLAGDTVVLDRRRRPAAKTGPEPASARAWDAWRGRATVPQGHVWVEGDNHRDSLDSNDYGPISKSLIVGRAVVVVTPLDRFWTKPWTEFCSRTKVIENEGKIKEWTEGLPVELAEIRDPHAPP